MQLGWSPGARHCMQFAWVRNILRAYARDTSSIQREGSALCALFAALLKSTLPIALRKDLEDFVAKMGLPPMDAGLSSKGPVEGTAERQYTMNINGQKISFKDVDLAPPCAVAATNYARLVITTILFTADEY